MLNETLNFRVYAREEHWEEDLLVGSFASEEEADKCADALEKFSSIAVIQIRKAVLVERKKRRTIRCDYCEGTGKHRSLYFASGVPQKCDVCRGTGTLG